MTDPETNEKAPRRIGVRAFRGNVDAILRQARASTAFLVTDRGEVLAEIRPPAQAPHAARKPGALRGRIHMPPDFDTLPSDMLAVMHGKER